MIRPLAQPWEARPQRARMHRPRSRSHTSLALFAFTAAVAFVLVTVIDPYSGATASPYYQPSGARFNGEAAQSVTIAGTYTNAVSRDNFTVTDPPPPPPPVAAAKKSFSAPSAAVPDPGSAQAYAYDAVHSRGWGEDQYGCLVSLWSRESGWRVNAMNTSSGAYGIPQALPGSKMASAGSDWETNAGTQIEWGLGYISGRYGTPCGAWAHSEDAGWY
ncbi:lytic transglycosylase domain-containing protein [Glaciibacter sp. 2TAF33]|uniref:aggregation-promoting factor C-terminal-like domain-containing protein n=1 Tax=Glaciibacter sp. 2TAF33 TaxID=3233015 RepID=UPI003F91FDFC